jgi:Domain of unknown function (DUF4419)
MNKATTSTFSVSDVEPATTPLLEVPYKEAVEALLITAATTRCSRSVEACARYHGHLIAGVPFHPVVAAAHRAFMDHRPLCLSPDMIWLVICQGVANHINVNADALRSHFVHHQGKMQISVRRDDFVKGSPENPWAEAIEEFTEKVNEHVGSDFDLFQPKFTTTGPVERAAAGVVLLDAMRSYFTYDMDTLCGIPAVSLEGTPEDWQTVADRAELFGSLDLEWWLEPLRGILNQFVAASQGVVDRQFWQSLYKYHDESGGPTMTGWISALFPYLNDGRTGLAIHQNPYLTLNSQRVVDVDGDIDDEIDDIDIDDEIDDMDIDDEIDDIDIDDQIDDIDIDDEIDDEIDDLHSDPDGVGRLGQEEGLKGPAPKQRLNRLILPRQPHEDAPRLVDRTEDPDLDDALDEDVEDDPEYLVGVWLRPIPQRRREKNQSTMGKAVWLKGCVRLGLPKLLALWLFLRIRAPVPPLEFFVLLREKVQVIPLRQRRLEDLNRHGFLLTLHRNINKADDSPPRP